MKKYCIAVNGSIPWHSYGVGLSLAIWDHTVSPATRHKWTHPALTPAMQAWGRYSIYLPRRDGRLSSLSWLDSAPAGSRTSDLSITSPTPNHCNHEDSCVLSYILASFQVRRCPPIIAPIAMQPLSSLESASLFSFENAFEFFHEWKC